MFDRYSRPRSTHAHSLGNLPISRLGGLSPEGWSQSFTGVPSGLGGGYLAGDGEDFLAGGEWGTGRGGGPASPMQPPLLANANNSPD